MGDAVQHGLVVVVHAERFAAQALPSYSKGPLAWVAVRHSHLLQSVGQRGGFKESLLLQTREQAQAVPLCSTTE